MRVEHPTPAEARRAWAVSSLTTLLWVATALPAGGGPPWPADDVATPIHRATWLLVPPMVLLVLLPVGVTLARTRIGLRAVLAATDAFVALVAGAALAGHGLVRGTLSAVLVGLLFGVGALSLVETARLLRTKREHVPLPTLRGLRVVLCVLVLMLPAWFFVQAEADAASLLGPYALLAIGAGGATTARTSRGLRVTGALVHLVLAGHVFVTLRWTIFEAAPGIEPVGRVGWAAVGLAGAILVLTVLQAGVLLRRLPRPRGA